MIFSNLDVSNFCCSINYVLCVLSIYPDQHGRVFIVLQVNFEEFVGDTIFEHLCKLQFSLMNFSCS